MEIGRLFYYISEPFVTAAFLLSESPSVYKVSVGYRAFEKIIVLMKQ